MVSNPDYKLILKDRGFRWKKLTNNCATGRRIQILELVNKRHKEQLKASTAFMYRRNLNTADFQKEPFSLSIQNRFTIGDKQNAEQAGVCQPTEAISIAAIVNDLVQYKGHVTENEEFIGQLPQYSQQLQELKETLLKGEVMIQDQIGDRKILPAECSVGMNGTLIESRFFQDVRFTAVDQASLAIDGEEFRYLRIKGHTNAPVTVAKPDANFKQIIILPGQSEMSVVIMVWHSNPTDLGSQDMHRTVKQSLNNIKEQSEDLGVKAVWVPAFKMRSENDLAQDFLGFQVSQSGKLVSQCAQTTDIEMYALPESDGTIKVNEPDLSDRSTIVISGPFILAVTTSHVEESLEVPIVVANIDKKFWIHHE